MKNRLCKSTFLVDGQVMCRYRLDGFVETLDVWQWELESGAVELREVFKRLEELALPYLELIRLRKQHKLIDNRVKELTQHAKRSLQNGN